MSVRRVVVDLEPGAHGRAALEAAVALAEQFEAELLGLFLEDSDLLQFAGLPFASEIGFASAVRRQLDVSAMQRSMRARADDAHRALASVVSRSRVRWTYQVSQGAHGPSFDAAAGETALVVSCVDGHSHRLRALNALRIAAAIRSPLLLVRDRLPAQAPVVLVCSTDDDPRRVAVAARELLRGGNAMATILLAHDPQADVAAWRGELMERAGLHAARLQVVAVDRSRLAATAGDEIPRGAAAIMLFGAGDTLSVADAESVLAAFSAQREARRA